MKVSRYPTAREILFVLAIGLTMAMVSHVGTQWVVWFLRQLQ